MALYTDADEQSVYVRSADHAIRIGEGRTAYLDSDAVIEGLKRTECDAAWLGWGFASEDGDFCAALEDAGITLLAPRPEVMTALGDKISAKELAEKHQVPVAPWSIVESPEAAVEAASGIGFPLLLKAAGGGGGRGIRLVHSIDEVAENFISARDEAARSFRTGRLHGKVRRTGTAHRSAGPGRRQEDQVLGVRDCSLQRRRRRSSKNARLLTYQTQSLQW